ncbi:MAG: VCBS repeat-containing protein, partial [Vicinamibacteria bacterium]|nr:VCBS repeat-containing protein [Vicinamibacteria bacterium]
DGRSLVWFITGDSLKGFAFLDYTLDASWQIVATLDGNGDGAADVLYWQPSTGRLRVVLHRGANRLSDYTLSDSILAPWGVVGAPDLNADGSDDLLILNRTTGQMVAGLLNGSLLTNGGLFTVTRAAPSTWNVASTGTDFDADGHADLLWHDTISGVFSVWFMNGKTKLGEGTFIPFSNTDPAWQVVGAANVW